MSAVTSASYDPNVRPTGAGRPANLGGVCSGEVPTPAMGSTIVLTTTALRRRGTGGPTPGNGPSGRGVSSGRAGPGATCPYPRTPRAATDLNYAVVAPGSPVLWGHLNGIGPGHGRLPDHPAGTRPLACRRHSDRRPRWRSTAATSIEAERSRKGENHHPEGRSYFPCMVAAAIQVGVGDSGGAVLVRGIPAGVTSRRLRRMARVHPVAEGMAELDSNSARRPTADSVPQPPGAPTGTWVGT